MRVGVLMRARARAAALLLAACVPALPLLAPASAHADVVRNRQRPVLNALNIPDAWKITRGRGATVAVVDSGVDSTHPDLRGSVSVGTNMLAAVDGDTLPTRRHGTGMASLIVGHGHGPGRGSGIIGIAPQARALAVRVLAEPEDPGYRRYLLRGGASPLARGIRYAADHGVDVINLSLGKYEEERQDREAIGYAIGKGVVVVAAVGNDGDKRRRFDSNGHAPYSFPASYPGVVAVAATDPQHKRADFSNENYSVLVSAPGVAIPSASPDGNYYLTYGTSDATALVSGIAALIRSRYKGLPPALVAQALIASARYGPSGGYNAEVGFGEVNAVGALGAAGRLAGAAGLNAGGLASSQRFGAQDTGPVRVIDRPPWTEPLAYAVLAIAVACVALALVVAARMFRRPLRFGPMPSAFAFPSGFGPPSPAPFGRPTHSEPALATHQLARAPADPRPPAPPDPAHHPAAPPQHPVPASHPADPPPDSVPARHQADLPPMLPPSPAEMQPAMLPAQPDHPPPGEVRPVVAPLVEVPPAASARPEYEAPDDGRLHPPLPPEREGAAPPVPAEPPQLFPPTGWAPREEPPRAEPEPEPEHRGEPRFQSPQHPAGDR